MKNVSDLQRRAHQTAVDKGWHESDELFLPWFLTIIQRAIFAIARLLNCKPTARQKLAWLSLVTDELDEAACETEPLYTGKDGKPEGILIELTDALIRLLDMAGACGWDLGAVLGNDGDHDNPFSYDVPQCRTEMVAAIRVGSAEQEQFAAALFLAVLAMLLKARNEASDGDESPNPPTVEELLEIKDAFNRTREHRHGGKLA